MNPQNKVNDLFAVLCSGRNVISGLAGARYRAERSTGDRYRGAGNGETARSGGPGVRTRSRHGC